MKSLWKTDPRIRLALGVAWFLMNSHALTGQDKGENGLYLSREDFLIGHLSGSHSTDSLNFIGTDLRGDLYIVRDGAREFVPLKSIFGFGDRGISYRAYAGDRKSFSNSGYYRVEDMAAIVVYSKRGFNKTANTVFYYYSTSIDGPIVRLSVRRLRHQFSDPVVVTQFRKRRHQLTAREGEHMVVNNIIQ